MVLSENQRFPPQLEIPSRSYRNFTPPVQSGRSPNSRPDNSRFQIPSCKKSPHWHFPQASQTQRIDWCRRGDSNPHEGCPSTDFKSVASTIPPRRRFSRERGASKNQSGQCVQPGFRRSERSFFSVRILRERDPQPNACGFHPARSPPCPRVWLPAARAAPRSPS